MKISIASYSFHGLSGEGKMNVFGYLETCKHRYGLDTADLWNGTVGSTDESFLRKVRQTLDENEMTLVNYHADGPCVWEDDPAAREKNYKLALEHLRAAEILGAKTVRIDTGSKKVVPMNQEQCDYVVKRYREYAKRGADAGFRVGPETHWGFSLLIDNMEKIAKGVDSPAYGVLLHIGHWEQIDPEEADRRIARWACHTHVDAKITRTCLEPRLKMLLDAGYQGYWVVEHHSAKNEYFEVACQLAEVRRVVNRLNNPEPAAAKA